MNAHPSLAPVTTTIGAEVTHEVGFAVLVRPKSSLGLGFAVVDQASSQIIGWDGWYGLPGLPASDFTPLHELDKWIDRDDMASRMVLDRSATWLAVLAEWLCPHYSFAKLSESILMSHGYKGVTDLPGDWNVVAYYPTSMSLAEARAAAV